MKKFFALLMAASMLAVCLTSCATGAGTSNTTDPTGSKVTEAAQGKGKTLDQIKAAGELIAATSPDFPPFESLENNNVVGIEVDIMTAVCKKLGVKFTIKQMNFETVLTGVQTGKFDLGMSGITVNETRQKNALFTDPYCLAAQAIVVKVDSSITCKADLAGKTVSVQTGTTAESYCNANGYTVKSFAANSDAAMAMTSGKVDAWVIDDLTAAEMVKELNGVKILDEAMTTEPYAFEMAFGSETLRDAINPILKEMLADGTIKAIFEKYDAPFTAPSAS